jgi:hypothetical protein
MHISMHDPYASASPERPERISRFQVTVSLLALPQVLAVV